MNQLQQLFSIITLPFAFLVLLFFVTSIVGVVTGSNSLITVPAMFQFGIDPKVAVATNMFGLTFMAIGGTLPFIGKNAFPRKHLSPLIALTLVSSTLGALLVLVIPTKTLPVVVSLAMFAVTAFIVFKKNKRIEAEPAPPPSRAMELTAYALTFLLGIYGGFYSGGYVTMLTALFVGFFHMKFVEAVATTKLINVFSSLVATIVFMWRGLVDYKLGIALGIAMFAGAFVGARIALKLNEIWLRRIFIATVVLLAAKILFYDYLLKGRF